MTEIIIVVILLSLGVVSLILYVIFIDLRKNQGLHRAYKQRREIIRVEKELDRTDSIKRGLKFLKTEKRIKL